MKKFSSLLAIALQMLILPVFNPGEVLADTHESQDVPVLITQEAEMETVELTIEPPLTAEQETKLEEINTQYQAKIQEAFNKYIESLKAIDSLLGTNPDNETIRERYSEAQTNRNNISNLLLERLLEFRAVLTPEQQASISDDIRSYLESRPEQQQPN